MNRMCRNVVWLFVLFVGMIFVKNVYATASCTASISPSSVAANSQTQVNFSVTNTGDENITYVEMYSPSNDLIPVNTGISGWSVETSQTWVGIYGNSISPGGTFNFSLGANAGSQEIPAANWSVAIYTNTGYAECTGGSLSMSISGIADGAAPVMSEPSITSLTNSSATVSWTTDEPSTSDLYYGLTFETTDTQKYDATLTTSHTVNITGLSAGTSYYFKYRSVDESGNASGWKDFYSFSTPTYAEAETVVQTVTQTVTIQATPPPVEIKTIIIQDITAPSVAISTDLVGVFDVAPTIRGVAQDSKGVFRVDYSTDGGRNWLPVDEMSDPEAQKVSFVFTPLGLLDGNYILKVRAIDTSNNAGFSKEQTLIIDRLPPRVGSTLLTIGTQPLKPTRGGLVYGLVGVNQRIILSSVGGATSIDLITEDSSLNRSMINTNSFVLGASEQKYSLAKNTELGLWFGTMNFSNPGLYKLIAQAIDGAQNKTERELQSVYVLPNGRVFAGGGVVSGVEIIVHVFNPNTNRYVIWDGEAFLQNNPQKTNPEGEYGMILPPGKYYLEASLKGYKLVRTPIFTLTDHTPINTDFNLEKLSTFTIFGREFFVPTFKKTVIPVMVDLPTGFVGIGTNDLAGKELPYFLLKHGDKPLYGSDLVGKPTVLSFLNTWTPNTSEQLGELDKLMGESGVRTVGIFEQETISGVSLFIKRGGYKTSIWADEDGELVDDFSIHTTPTHILIDSKGIVKDVVVGFSTKEELLDKLY